jgi:hypothetical protein
VPKAKLDEVWQTAFQAYEKDDCLGFVDAAGRYYGLIMYSTFSWDTEEIGRAYNYCLGVLDSALRERDALRRENADLRRRLTAGTGATSSSSYGVRQKPPSISSRAPHSILGQ